MKVLVQTRIATKRLETMGETMQTTTMAYCWLEGSVLMTIVDSGENCGRPFQKVEDNKTPDHGHYS